MQHVNAAIMLIGNFTVIFLAKYRLVLCNIRLHAIAVIR